MAQVILFYCKQIETLRAILKEKKRLYKYRLGVKYLGRIVMDNLYSDVRNLDYDNSAGNIPEHMRISCSEKDTTQIAIEMLAELAQNGTSSMLLKDGGVSWLTTLELKDIDNAKKLLAQHEPETVQKLEHILPQLETYCPELAVLKQTTPYAQMKLPANRHSSQVVTNPLNAARNIPPAEKQGWYKNLQRDSQIGSEMTCTPLTGAAIYSLVAHNQLQRPDEIQEYKPTPQMLFSPPPMPTPMPRKTRMYSYNPYQMRAAGMY